MERQMGVTLGGVFRSIVDGSAPKGEISVLKTGVALTHDGEQLRTLSSEVARLKAELHDPEALLNFKPKNLTKGLEGVVEGLGKRGLPVRPLTPGLEGRGGDLDNFLQRIITNLNLAADRSPPSPRDVTEL